ncbi:MAG TPA: family 16 glycosylhydrolase [Dongiaceae bacterium]
MAAGAQPLLAQDPAKTGGSFVERFETFEQGRWLVSDGWTNGEHQSCIWSAKNLSAGEHSVELTLRDVPPTEPPPAEPSPVQPPSAAPSLAEPSPAKPSFTCAELQTRETFGYGTYEVRMRAARPAVPGLVSAFFTYIGPTADRAAPHDEIDFEFVGKDAGAVELNFFANGVGNHSKIVKLGFDATQTMADYAFEWLPDGIRWYVNGALVHEAARIEGSPFPVTPGKIMISVWSGHGLDQWLGAFRYPGKPLAARYELIAYTKPGDPCQFPASIVCKLRK